MDSYRDPLSYSCKFCGKGMLDRNSLIEHLKTHEPLEILSYVAVTMMDEQNRDVTALELHRRFEGLKRAIGE
jgi:hypothetical protein